MGEVTSSDVKVVEEEIEREEAAALKGTGLARWETFLPRTFLRVLLVEEDDSTRQVIAALLHKCSYEVAAISDGSEAWKMLKEKSQNIDLILTEVQLPSISGLDLLNLIMGHDTCKTIPVIMMSSNDSIGMVFKCMMRGAVDFLIKPIRRNELRNLWQHVWRRRNSSSLGFGTQNGILLPEKHGATSENNAASNHSSDYYFVEQKNEDCIRKASDTQSSGTKPLDRDDESACLNKIQELLLPESSSPGFVRTYQKHDNHDRFICMSVESKAKGDNVVAPVSNGCYIDQFGVEFSTEAIDLIRKIDHGPKCSYECTDNNTTRADFLDGPICPPGKKTDMPKIISSSPLELSLSRFEPCGTQRNEDNRVLNHSKASAFSRYNNKTLKNTSTPSSSINKSEQIVTVEPPSYSSDALAAIQCSKETQKKVEDKSSDNMFLSCPRLGMIPATVPCREIPLEGCLNSGYGAYLHTMIYAHPAAPPGPPPWTTDLLPAAAPGPPVWTSNSKSMQEALHNKKSFHQSSHKICEPVKDNYPSSQTAIESCDHPMATGGCKIEPREDQNNPSAAVDRSGDCTFCDSSKCLTKNSGYSCNGDEGNRHVNSTAIATSECGINEGIFASDQIKMKDCQRISQREAALNKFRLKRKDRCYEKKVRYHSRKRIAEQRPRVKGQFVRRVLSDSHQPVMESDGCL